MTLLMAFAYEFITTRATGVHVVLIMVGKETIDVEQSIPAEKMKWVLVDIGGRADRIELVECLLLPETAQELRPGLDLARQPRSSAQYAPIPTPT